MPQWLLLWALVVICLTTYLLNVVVGNPNSALYKSAFLDIRMEEGISDLVFKCKSLLFVM
jgi:hypothetical protein